MSYRKFLGAAALMLAAGLASAAFPDRELTGVIMWGAGGAMDVVSRAVTPHAEAALGKKIVLVNKPGGTGRHLDQLRHQRAVRRLHAALRRRESAAAPGAGTRRLRLREVLPGDRVRARRRGDRRQGRLAVEHAQGLRRGREEAPRQAQDGLDRPRRAAAHRRLDAELGDQVPGHLGALRRRRPRHHRADGRARRHHAGRRGCRDREHQGRPGQGAGRRRRRTRCRSRAPRRFRRSPRTIRSSASTCRGDRSTACSSSATRPTTSRRRWSRRSRPPATIRSSRR